MSGYLTHSVSSTGNRKIFTISAWVKINGTTTNQSIFGTGTAGSNSGKFYFAISSGAVRIGGGANVYLVTNRLLRDSSSWYHLVCAVDTSQATSSNRIKFYINGVQETSFSTSTYPSQDQNTPVNESGKINTFGAEQGGGESWDGSMTHMVLVDGTQLTPSNFGETDSTTGEWKPKADPTGVTYGTNGVFMKCENSGNFGLDSSGQGNNYTSNRFPTGAHAKDSASNNYATWNPLVIRSFQYPMTLTEGNLKVIADSNTSYGSTVAATVSLGKGKWYWEFKYTTSGTGGYVVGWGEDTYDFNYQTDAYPYKASLGSTSGVFYRADGGKVVNGTETASAGATWSQNDIIGIAVDLDNGNITFYKNGSSQFSETSVFTSTLSYYPEFYGYGSKGGQANFGNPSYTIASGNADANGHGNFEYSVPTGYYALCTKNINTYG